MKFKEQYERSKRFDEGLGYQSQEYIAYVKERARLEEAAQAVYGAGVRLLLEEYADLCADLIELESRHFFEEGYLAAEEANRGCAQI